MKAMKIDPRMAIRLCSGFANNASTFDMKRKAILVAIAMLDTM